MPDRDEQREIFEQVLERMDECAVLLRGLHNDRIDAYCLADFEGQDGGWLGESARDIIEQEMRALDEEDDR